MKMKSWESFGKRNKQFEIVKKGMSIIIMKNFASMSVSIQQSIKMENTNTFAGTNARVWTFFALN